ncbi:MAG TPA: hypothetical protein VGN82_19700 [Bosea sp. (in: a-proteobacteria)]|jgi:hypothetical protein|uniref:hypothetical protein n=1 Tax=Bosea sp. (in: a-proteobacteria) TaxID=1871050 RepID=UPI002E0F4580|nr:hypothetical protein [Bosea sp. (in: a-proteobacteria)]
MPGASNGSLQDHDDLFLTALVAARMQRRQPKKDRADAQGNPDGSARQQSERLDLQ